jgi:hypothetical protein
MPSSPRLKSYSKQSAALHCQHYFCFLTTPRVRVILIVGVYAGEGNKAET